MIRFKAQILMSLAVFGLTTSSVSAGFCPKWVADLAHQAKEAVFPSSADRLANQVVRAVVAYKMAHSQDDAAAGGVALIRAASYLMEDVPELSSSARAYDELWPKLLFDYAKRDPRIDRLLRSSVRDRILKFGRTAGLALGPSLVYPIWWAINFRKNLSTEFRMPIRRLVNDGYIPVEQDEFFERSMDFVRRVSGPSHSRRLRTYRGVVGLARSFAPAALTAALFAVDAHPLGLFYTLSAPVPDSYPVVQFLSVLESQDFRFAPDGKKIAIIIDSKFAQDAHLNGLARRASAHHNSLEVLTELDYLRAQASEVQEFIVSNSEDLNRALIASSNAEIVYTIGHGRPGRLIMGGDDLLKSLGERSKDGPSKDFVQKIVFVSCDYGSTTASCAEEEAWVIAGGQMAATENYLVASAVDPLSFTYDASGANSFDLSFGDVARWSLRRAYVGTKYAMTGRLHWAIVKNLWGSDPQGVESWNQPGMRVYDSSAMSSQFFSVRSSDQSEKWILTVSSRAREIRGSDLPPEKKGEFYREWVKTLDGLVETFQFMGPPEEWPEHKGTVAKSDGSGPYSAAH